MSILILSLLFTILSFFAGYWCGYDTKKDQVNYERFREIRRKSWRVLKG